MAKEKQFSAKGWKSNKALQEISDKYGRGQQLADYINSPNFTEKDYVDIMAGLYPDLGPSRYSNLKALTESPLNTLANNSKAVDLGYDALKLKEDWNSKNPNNPIDLDDHVDAIKSLIERSGLTSKKIHDLVTDPKYMLDDRYSKNKVPPTQVLKNPKIKPEHLYKFLTHHPEHVDEIVGHEQADDHLENLIFDNPEHLKNVSNMNLERYLNSKLSRAETGQKQKLNISPKRAKTIVETSHDKLYNDALFRTMAAMDPNDKKDFIDRKMGIAGGKVAGLGAWRTNDEAANQQLAGQWDDWQNGPEYDPKFAKRIASSPHITDDQAEHIKRHGDFDSKYELYHNKNVDPRHGAEMFKMWHDNEEDKGYSASQLQEKYKKDKDDVYTIDDIDPDLIDEDRLNETADESTRENYDFGSWVDDNEDDLLKDVELDDKREEQVNDKLREDYDWTGENPNHNKELFDHHEKIINAARENENGKISVADAEKLTKKNSRFLELHGVVDSDGFIDPDELEEYRTDNNPEEINYSSSENHNIDEHPEYQDRYDELVADAKKDQIRNDPYSLYDSHYENYQNSEDYQSTWADAMKDAKEDAAREHFGELYNTSHQDDRFIPEHLKAHIPNINEIQTNRKKAIGESTDMLDKYIPKRSYEHPYGEDQHLYETVKDYADANGGSIDIGRMHKLMPNQGDTWKKIFSNKGKLSSDEVQQKIEALPKTPYAISYGKWDSNKTQNLNHRDQIVFRLDHTDESLKPLKEDPELFRTFQKVQEVSKRSGHPTKDNSIAWARVDTTDPDHWMVDEVQSDFGKTVREYLKRNNEEDKANHIQKIDEHHKNWRESLINAVIKEAKKHGASKVSTHSPESKSAHTGSENVHSVYKDSYQKVPRRMGFKPAPAQTLPITDEVRESVFNKKSTEPTKDDLGSSHKDAWEKHKQQADLYENMAENYHKVSNTIPLAGNPAGWARKFKEMSNYHQSIAEKHQTRAKEYGIPHEEVSVFPINLEGYGNHKQEAAVKNISENKPFEHIADKELNNPANTFDKPASYHEGHTLNLKPNVLKSMLDIVEDLVKFELIYKNAEDVSIKKRARINIELIKNMLGYEPDLSKWENKRRKFSNIKKAVDTDEDSNPLMNRMEDKYFLKADKLNDVIAKLKQHLPNGDIDTSTRYSINQTIYLDNRDLDSYQDNMMGVKPRFKVRIRRYNPNGEGWEDVAYIELKIKEKDGMTRKLRVRIPEAMIEDTSNGVSIQVDDALIDLNRDLEKTTLWKRVALINSTIMKYGFKKQLVVEYNRRAYSDNGLRITIDDSLKYHSFQSIEKDVMGYITNSDHWKKNIKPVKKLMSNDILIMEVKHEENIPSWVKDLLKESKAKEVKFSKYSAAISTFIMNGGSTEGRIQQQKRVGAYEILDLLHSEPEMMKSENDLIKAVSGLKLIHKPFTADPKIYDPRKHDFIVEAHHNGKKVGFIAMTHKKDGVMPFNFEVAKEHRGQGIGTKLMQTAEKISGKPYKSAPDQTPAAKGFAAKYKSIAKSVSGKHLQKLEILMKARPKQIKLMEGGNKGRIANVVGENARTSGGGEAFQIQPRTGSSKLGAAGGGFIASGKNAIWNKDRKHKVITEGSKTPATSYFPQSPSSGSNWGGYSDDKGHPGDSGKLTSKKAHPGIPHSLKQKQLMHGIDLSNVKQQSEGWTSSLALSGFGKNSSGKNVIIKGHLDPEGEADIGSSYDHKKAGGMSTSQREALYHNLAHGPFNLGKFVPTTAVAHHNGTHYSVMEKIPNAEHYQDQNTSHENIMKKATKSGDIQKLAIMNMILGNSDRHGGNYMVSPKGLHLIDHGLTFNYQDNGRDILRPDYARKAYPDHDYSNFEKVKMHPEAAKWLKNLDLKEFQKQLKAHKIHNNFKKSILGALQIAKSGLQSKKSFGEVLNDIIDFHGDNAN